MADGASVDGAAYMARVRDREHPLARDSPTLLQPLRPAPPGPTGPPPARQPVTVAAFQPLPLVEQERLHAQYYQLAAQPATKMFDTFPGPGVVEVVPGRAWVVPSLLSPSECEEVSRRGEEHGMGDSKGSQTGANPRTSRRTNDYGAPWLTALVSPRLPEELLQLVEGSAPHTAVRGVHTNWRVACYGPGQTFPAHYDLSDTITLEGAEEGTKELCTSTHTLLVYLSAPADFQGGATRLFLTGQYDQDTVDVRLPQGAGLVFQQKGMLHAGLEVEAPIDPAAGPGCKYIAQAGVLRGQGEVRAAPSLFKLGPGLRLQENKVVAGGVNNKAY